MSEPNGVEAFAVAGGPGRHLREAREARHLTVAQVAAQLRLQSRIIEALEHDDYHNLPGSTFVQGYLRSYARLLGLAEDHLVGLAQLEGVTTPSLVSSIGAGGSDEASSRDLPFRIVSYLILLVVVVGLGWWLSQREPQSMGLSSPAVSTTGGEQGLLLPEEAPSLPVEVSLVAETVDAGEVETAPDESAPAEEAPAAEAEEAAVVAAPPVAAPQAAATVNSPDAPPTLTETMPQSRLELEYREKSWTEISDAAGRKLAYGLIPEGKRLTLRGEAPFRVFLGYADGVRVYYNGDLFDHTPFQNGDMARFRLGRAEHNRPLSR
ncbi:MAG: DUF4115 domain-containing protein [Gammaproteobacteria bacterium]|nr:DUF4115 domain-containing protein [Gammaproteobacteria bacterium]